jgi:hypothetical protein
MEARRETVTKFRFNKLTNEFVPTAMTVTVHDSVRIMEEDDKCETCPSSEVSPDEK